MAKKVVRGASLKTKNLKWLVPLFGANVAFLIVALLGVSALSEFAGSPVQDRLNKAMLALLCAFFAIVIANILPTTWKDILVFWRLRNVLPGHRAFSVYGRIDPRFTYAQLAAKLGPLPKAAKDQNSLWYTLLKKHESRAEIAGCHQLFLLFRDASGLAFIFFVGYVVVALAVGSFSLGWTIAFAAQLVVVVLAANQCGKRLVQNVLALEVI